MSIKYVEIGDSMYSEIILYQGEINGDDKDYIYKYLNNVAGFIQNRQIRSQR